MKIPTIASTEDLARRNKQFSITLSVLLSAMQSALDQAKAANIDPDNPVQMHLGVSMGYLKDAAIILSAKFGCAQ